MQHTSAYVSIRQHKKIIKKISLETMLTICWIKKNLQLAWRQIPKYYGIIWVGKKIEKQSTHINLADTIVCVCVCVCVCVGTHKNQCFRHNHICSVFGRNVESERARERGRGRREREGRRQRETEKVKQKEKEREWKRVKLYYTYIYTPPLHSLF